MSDFVPIFGCPGYGISPLGQVRSESSGLILSHDKRGRIKLRSGKKYSSFFVGELLARVDCPGQATIPAQDSRAVELENRIAELEERLSLARRANGHLLALVANLRKEIANPGTSKGKKTKPIRLDDDLNLHSLNFDELP